MQTRPDAFEGTVVALVSEALVDNHPETIALGQVTPFGALAQDAEDAIEHLPIITAWTSYPLWRKDDVFDQRLMLIRKLVTPTHACLHCYRKVILANTSFQTSPIVNYANTLSQMSMT